MIVFLLLQAAAAAAAACVKSSVFAPDKCGGAFNFSLTLYWTHFTVRMQRQRQRQSARVVTHIL